MILIRRLGCNYKIEDEEYFIKGDYIEEFLRIEDPNELKACCRKRIEYVAQNIKSLWRDAILPPLFHVEGLFKRNTQIDDAFLTFDWSQCYNSLNR